MGINMVWKAGTKVVHYGFIGAVGIAVLSKGYDFMPEDFEDRNCPRLWAINWLARGAIEPALLELKIKEKYEVKRINLPDIEEDFDGYIKALEELKSDLKEKGL